MIIIGIDPGTRITGYGIIQLQGTHYKVIDFGCIKPPASDKLTDRYLALFEGLDQLLEQHQPETLVVETQYVNKNVQSAIKLGMARGIAILAAKRKGLSVFEYPPTRAKQAVVGTGSASKAQVQQMVKVLLNLKEIPWPEDAADALSLAICHAHTVHQRALTAVEI